MDIADIANMTVAAVAVLLAAITYRFYVKKYRLSKYHEYLTLVKTMFDLRQPTSMGNYQREQYEKYKSNQTHEEELFSSRLKSLEFKYVFGTRIYLKLQKLDVINGIEDVQKLLISEEVLIWVEHPFRSWLGKSSATTTNLSLRERSTTMAKKQIPSKHVAKPGDLRIMHVPQVGSNATFLVPVKTVEEGVRTMDLLARYDLFQYEHKIKPDYANFTELEKFTDAGEWESWYSDDEEHDDPREYLKEHNKLDELRTYTDPAVGPLHGK